MIAEFVAEMARFVPPDARIMLTQFRGSPERATARDWRAVPIRDAQKIDDEANVYLCVSAMRRNERGEFRRRKDNFAGGILLMVDDLGDGPGSKFPLSKIGPLPPTALIETSPRNFQAVYFFDRLLTDIGQFEALIQAFIRSNLLGNDPGMSGVNRVFRPPAGVNGKEKHNGWKVRIVPGSWEPGNRYSPEKIAAAFSLSLKPLFVRIPRGATEDKAENIREFLRIFRLSRAAGVLKRERADISGWIDVSCPFRDGHTGRIDNGAAIRMPSEENGWKGAFRCHHGSCSDRGWRDFSEAVLEGVEEALERAALNDSVEVRNAILTPEKGREDDRNIPHD